MCPLVVCGELSRQKLLVPEEKFFLTYSRQVTRRSEHNREGKTHHRLGGREKDRAHRYAFNAKVELGGLTHFCDDFRAKYYYINFLNII